MASILVVVGNTTVVMSSSFYHRINSLCTSCLHVSILELSNQFKIPVIFKQVSCPHFVMCPVDIFKHGIIYSESIIY